MYGDKGRYLVVCVLLAAIAIAGHLAQRPVKKQTGSLHLFERVPVEIQGWRGEDAQVSQAVIEYLSPDAFLSRIYRKGELAITFTAIFAREWRSIHSPAGCYPNQGWHTIERKRILIRGNSPGPAELHAEQLFVTRSGEYRLVMYLYAYPGGTTSNWTEQCMRIAAKGMRNGGMVIIEEAICTPDRLEVVDQAERELLRLLYPYVVEVWNGKGQS